MVSTNRKDNEVNKGSTKKTSSRFFPKNFSLRKKKVYHYLWATMGCLIITIIATILQLGFDPNSSAISWLKLIADDFLHLGIIFFIISLYYLIRYFHINRKQNKRISETIEKNNYNKYDLQERIDFFDK